MNHTPPPVVESIGLRTSGQINLGKSAYSSRAIKLTTAPLSCSAFSTPISSIREPFTRRITGGDDVIPDINSFGQNLLNKSQTFLFACT